MMGKRCPSCVVVFDNGQWTTWLTELLFTFRLSWLQKNQ